MTLLPIILTPVGIMILLLVMSWAERALDSEPRPERTQPTHILLAAAPVAALSPVELTVLIEPVTAQ